MVNKNSQFESLITDLRTIDFGGEHSPLLTRYCRCLVTFMYDLLQSNSQRFCVPPVKHTPDFDAITSNRVNNNPSNAAILFMLPWSAPEAYLPRGYDAVRFTSDFSPTTNASKDFLGIEEEVIKEFSSMYELAGELFSAPFREHSKNCKSCKLVATELIFAGPQYRRLNGTWVNHFALLDEIIPETATDVTMSAEQWLDLARKSLIQTLEKSETRETEAIIALSSLWRPTPEAFDPRDCGIGDILNAIRNEACALNDIPWRRLEEIVAELLRSRGMKIHVTKRSRDGGRDVIATGELIPGEPTVLAVEVKQKAVVGVQDLRAALWANRHFPALLFATSGRFTAGVLKEKTREDNDLRLMLKDGVALRQWIENYTDTRARL